MLRMAGVALFHVATSMAALSEMVPKLVTRLVVLAVPAGAP